MCLAGAVVACWSHTQEVAGTRLVMTNIFVTEFQRIQWKDLGKTPLSYKTTTVSSFVI